MEGLCVLLDTETYFLMRKRSWLDQVRLCDLEDLTVSNNYESSALFPSMEFLLASISIRQMASMGKLSL